MNRKAPRSVSFARRANYCVASETGSPAGGRQRDGDGSSRKACNPAPPHRRQSRQKRDSGLGGVSVLSVSKIPSQCRAADFDTESAETRVKPNRPGGRLMSAQASADSSKLGRCHLRRHQPSGFSASRRFGAFRVENSKSRGLSPSVHDCNGGFVPIQTAEQK